MSPSPTLVRLRLPSPVPSLQIIYNFVTPSEETYLLSKVDDIGGPASGATDEGGEEKARRPDAWKELNGRRSMYWGGTLLKSGALLQTPFPAFMDRSFPRILKRIDETGVFDTVDGGKGGPNHCLVNEYLPGQGIMPHTDGPSYVPMVTTLSLSSHTILSLRPTTLSPSSDEVSVLLPPRSLFILSGELYHWYHGIEWREVDSGEMLKKCVNWESYWDFDGGEVNEVGEAGNGAEEDGDDEEGEEDEERREREKDARRRLVEVGSGWERGRRVSLTCRRVAKVRKLGNAVGGIQFR